MRLPVISGFAKNVPTRRALATAAATATLGVALPVLAGGTPAWACGDPLLAGAHTVPWSTPGVAPASRFLRDKPAGISADGSWTTISVELSDGSGHDYENARPTLAFADPDHVLTPGDIQVRNWKLDGTEQALPLLPACSSLSEVAVDTSSMGRHVGTVPALYRFLVRLSPNTPASLTKLEVVTEGLADHTTFAGSSDLTTIQVTHPAAPSTAPSGKPSTKPVTKPSSKPSTKPTTAPAQAAVPAAPVAATSAAPSTAPSTAPTAAASGAPSAAASTAPAGGSATGTPTAEPSTATNPRLAYTGGGDTSWAVAGIGTALLAAGAGAVVFARRRPGRG
jgi:hypothetical protein